MPNVNPDTYHISASSIAAFKACPQRFRLGYREGLRLAEDTESQRVGTNWHALHEAWAECQPTANDPEPGPSGDDVAMNAVIALLNERYANLPLGKTTEEEWALERQILLTSFIAYNWYWQNDPLEFLASEVPFNLPLYLPTSGMPLPMSEVQRVGKIDHIVKWRGAVCALERKSTSRTISDDSDYWQRWVKDSQIGMYALAFRDLARVGGFGKIQDDVAFAERFGNTLVDVYHRPTIKPAMLTQKETAAFIETGEYCGQHFAVKHDQCQLSLIHVNADVVQAEMGKKGFAIRETVEMYAARLLQDMMERPEHYFRRKEIARTDQDLQHFQRQLFAVYQSQKAAEASGAWIEVESSCRATFPCAFIPVCYGPGADSVCDGKTIPPGFKRIYTDLTINGVTIEDD